MSKLSGFQKKVLSAAAATGASEAVRCDNDVKTLMVAGTFVATIHLEGSPDDGTTWITLGNVTAAGLVNVTNGFSYLRANVTAFTSGTIDSWIIY